MGEEQVISAKVCRWYGGKKAALSLRFDDSNTTHIEKAVPMLNEFGLIGTFLVNPGNESYKKYQSVWEGAVIAKGHELGDHTLSHNGAKTDEEAELQIGGCADYLRRVQPELKLKTLVQGGRTIWMQRKSEEFLRAKYGLASSSRRSMSCSEQYPSFTIDAFRKRLNEGIAAGDDLQFHFHPIAPSGGLYITESVFRQCLESVQAHLADLWQAGMSAINQYEVERDSSALWAYPVGDDALALRFACGADPDWYTQPLTLEVSLPAGVKSAEVRNPAGEIVASRTDEEGGSRLLRFDAAPSDAVYTVNAAGLGAAYLKEHGPDLAAPGPHPYLFFSKSDVDGLMKKAGIAPSKAIWDRIKERADEVVQTSLEETKERRFGQTRRVRLLAFAYAMTGDSKYIAPAVAGIEATVASDEWWTTKNEMLVTAETTCTLALAYDWMYDALTPELRQKVRDAIIQHGIEPLLEDTKKGEWYTIWYRCNWGGVIFSQAGVAALALLDDDPRAADWARLFIEKAWHYPQALDSAGGWGESGSYGTYIWFRVTLLSDAVKRITKGRMNLFASPRYPLLTQWFMSIMQPDERGFIPFSNCGQWLDGVAPTLYRLAREYGDGHAQWLASRISDRVNSADMFSFLWSDPEVEAKPSTDLPLAKLFPGISWTMLRNKWDDPNATLFALKGGQSDWDHGHHDANHFVLYAKGRPLIVDLLYPHKIWGCQTEVHNTIMVNGKDQRGSVRVAGGRGKPEDRTVVSDLVEAPWYARVLGDASLAYDQDDVRSFIREVMYLRQTGEQDPPDYFVLFDDADATAPSALDWMLHTYGEIKVDGDRVTITQDEVAADVTMVAPQKFTYETLERPLEDSGSESPFEGATSLRFIKLRPAEPAQRSYFLSVIAPRDTSVAPDDNLAVSAVRGDNTLGAKAVRGDIEDVALFALDQPQINGAGITSVGRTCFVRRANGKVAGMTLHDGESVSADGAILFETDSGSDAVITFGEKSIDAQLSIYDCRYVRLHADRKPTKVLVNGREREFEYEPDSQTVRVTGNLQTAEVKVLFD
jgi:hypothetical protein